MRFIYTLIFLLAIAQISLAQSNSQDSLLYMSNGHFYQYLKTTLQAPTGYPEAKSAVLYRLQNDYTVQERSMALLLRTTNALSDQDFIDSLLQMEALRNDPSLMGEVLYKKLLANYQEKTDSLDTQIYLDAMYAFRRYRYDQLTQLQEMNLMMGHKLWLRQDCEKAQSFYIDLYDIPYFKLNVGNEQGVTVPEFTAQLYRLHEEGFMGELRCLRGNKEQLEVLKLRPYNIFRSKQILPTFNEYLSEVGADPVNTNSDSSIKIRGAKN